jgi:hypothetical protein
MICPRCGHWNLLPSEGRWEALASCEHARRDLLRANARREKRLASQRFHDIESLAHGAAERQTLPRLQVRVL